MSHAEISRDTPGFSPPVDAGIGHRLLDALPGAVVAIDRAAVVLVWNAAAERFFGLPRDGAVGKSIAELPVCPTWRDRIGGAPTPFTTQGRDDVTLQWTVAGSPGAADGSPAVVIHGEDVTDRLAAERGRLRADERLARALDGAGEGIWEWDFVSSEGFASPSCAAMLGYAPGQITPSAHAWATLVHPDDQAGVLELMARHLTGGEQRFRTDVRLRRHDGSWTWVHVRGEVCRAPDESPLRMTGIMVDVTERRAMEEALRESQSRLAGIVESAMDAIIAVDDNGRMLLVNAAAERHFGRSAQQLIGLPVGTIVPAWPDAKVFAEWVGARGTIAELWARRADGSEFPIEATSARGGAGRGTTVVIRDITERITFQTRMRAQEEQLRHAQKMEAVGRLAGGVAHDFNNMLTAISGYAQLMQARGGLTPEQAVRTGEILKASQRATALTRQLLTFSRKDLLNRTTVQLDRVVDDVASMLDRLIGDDVELHLNLAAGDALVCTDPVQLQQVLMNLAINGRDAMPHGGVLSILTVRVERCEESPAAYHGTMTGPGILLTVADTGCGMDEATRERAFEPFFTTKEIGRGTGLGLATVYGIVEQSDGVIWIESTPGLGTRVCVCLPINACAEAPAEPVAPVGLPADGAGTVLLVEDELLVRDFARSILESAGYAVVTAENGAEGLAAWTAHRPSVDAVVTDLMLPGIGGRAMVDRIRTEAPDLPVLFMTGWTDAESMPTDALAANAKLITKPFAPHVLVEELARLIMSGK